MSEGQDLENWTGGWKALEPVTPPNWVKNDDPDKIFEDGSVFVVALRVRNLHTSEFRWEIERIRVLCDNEGYFELRYADTDDAYDAWEWDDFEYYIEVRS